MTPQNHGNIAAAYMMRMTSGDLAEIMGWFETWQGQCMNGTLSGAHEAATRAQDAITRACARMIEQDRNTISKIIEANRGNK